MFSHWEGGVDCVDENACDVVVSSNLTIEAVFHPGNVGPTIVGGGVPTPEASGAIGKIDAQFTVDRNGQSVYSIPIKVPPGVQGMEPQLALEYRSSNNDGIMGVGFALRGLSAIRRCPQNLAQDNNVEPLGHDQDDRFCLDGQRLVAIDGPYGSDGTTYGFEREDYTRVQQQGICNGGPCSFVAHSKNGTRLDFGTTADSILTGSMVGEPIRVWALTRRLGQSGSGFRRLRRCLSRHVAARRSGRLT